MEKSFQKTMGKSLGKLVEKSVGNSVGELVKNLWEKNDIRDVDSTADLVLVLLVYLVQWYLVHLYPLVPDST